MFGNEINMSISNLVSVYKTYLRSSVIDPGSGTLESCSFLMPQPILTNEAIPKSRNIKDYIFGRIEHFIERAVRENLQNVKK